MRLGYFAMPLHPGTRSWADTLREDREAVILADQLGFYDAFIGEHLTDRFENITNSLLFLATLIPETRSIKLATGTTNLSHQHPALVAANSAMFDHIAGGRFILGVSPGALPSDAELLGILDEDRNQLFADAVDIIVRMWEQDGPFDLVSPSGQFTVSTKKTYSEEFGAGRVRRPLQDPRPEIVGTVVAPYSKGAVAMGARDFHPLSANFLLPKWVSTHWGKYAEGKQSVGVEAQVSDWRVARAIFVADDEATARSYGKDDPSSPYRFYHQKVVGKMLKLDRAELFKSDPAQPDDTVTLESVLDQLVITGTPESVAEQILKLRETVGDFGELVYAGMDWVSERLGRRSMELMATEVMPLVEAEIGKPAALAGAAPVEN